jgi:hypothetical protein
MFDTTTTTSTVVKVANAFSIQMLKAAATVEVEFRPIGRDEARKLLAGATIDSCIGHPDTAAVVSADLEAEVPYRRAFATLEAGDTLLVCQLTGGRLPEGTTVLPEGFALAYWLVTIV